MKEGWEQKKLGDVCALINRGVAPKYIESGGLAVLNQKCVREHQISFELARRHDSAVKKVDQERFIRRGDVLVNSTGTGTLGRVAQVRSEPPEPATVDTHVTIVRPEPDRFHPDFFGYMLIQIEDEIARSGEGTSGQTELARSTLQNKFTVSFPTSISEQRRIVAILDEAFAGLATATVYAEKNLKNARELFESYLNSIFTSRDGEWVEKSLRDVSIQFGRGKSKHRPRNDPSLYDGKYPFVQTGDIRNSGGVIAEYSQTYNEIGLAQSKLWPMGTICITIAANIAETGILAFDACFPDSIIGMVVDPVQANNKFVEYLLRFFKAVLQAQGKGSAQDNINLATFENRKFPFPSIKTQDAVAAKLDSMAREVGRLEALYEAKLKSISEFKQSVLQKAFCGELTSSPLEAEAAE
ncbi:type I restriction enzyme S subunit [Bradyrhizobium sp. USDA 4463]